MASVADIRSPPTRELLNALVGQHLVGICTKIVCGSGISNIAFRLAPPIGGLSCYYFTL